MRLVEDHAAIPRQDGRIVVVPGRNPHLQVREEEGVVDDEHVGQGHVATSAVIVAFVVMRAFLAETGVRIALHLVPDVARRRERQVAPGTVPRLVQPRRQGVDVRRAFVFEQLSRRLGRQACPADGDVVGAALEKRPLDPRRVQGFGHHGQVLVDDLFLQVDGVRGDDRLFAVATRPVRGRNQVRERLARPRAGLHEPRASVVEAIHDEAKHLALPRPVFVSGPRREGAAGSQSCGQGRPVESLKLSSARRPGIPARRFGRLFPVQRVLQASPDLPILLDAGPDLLAHGRQLGRRRRHLGGLHQALEVVDGHPAHGPEFLQCTDEPALDLIQRAAAAVPRFSLELFGDLANPACHDPGVLEAGAGLLHDARQIGKRLGLRGRVHEPLVVVVRQLVAGPAAAQRLDRLVASLLEGRGRHVFSFFFFAAGKSTLFRMSR